MDVDEAQKKAKKKAKEIVKKARPEAKEIFVTELRRDTVTYPFPTYVANGRFEEKDKPHKFKVVFSRDLTEVLKAIH